MKINKILIIFLFFTKFNAGVHTQLRITNTSTIENVVDSGINEINVQQRITKVYSGRVDDINNEPIRDENGVILNNLSDQIKDLINESILNLDVSQYNFSGINDVNIAIDQNVFLTMNLSVVNNNPMNNLEVIRFKIKEQNFQNQNIYEGFLQCITIQVHPVVVNQSLKIFFYWLQYIAILCGGLGIFIISVIFGIHGWRNG